MQYVPLVDIQKDLVSVSDLKDERLKMVSMIAVGESYTLAQYPDITFCYHSKEKPFTLQDDVFAGQILYINPEYYQEHKEEVDLELSHLLASVQGKELIVGKSFINEKTALGIAQNQNLTEVSLQNYSLEKNVFDLLSQSKSIKKIITPNVESELANSYDPRIAYRMNQKIGIGTRFNTLEMLLTSKAISVDSCDLEEVFDVLKHRNKDLPQFIDIKVTDYSFLESFVKNIDSLYAGGPSKEDEVLSESTSNSFEDNLGPVTVSFELDPVNIDLSVLKRIEERECENIRKMIKENSETLSFSQAIQTEEKIRSLLEPVMAIQDQLSPFELYTKLYEVAKDFKSYQKEDEKIMSPWESRSVSNILFNDYIVCAGYVNLLQTFCKRFGLDTSDMHLSVMHEEQENVAVSGHARLLVHMKDEKYGIDGVYVSDPTWDSMGDYKYNHLLMTFEEVGRERDSEGIFDVTFHPYDFLKVKTKEELDEMLKNPTLREMFRKLPTSLRSIDKGAFLSSCGYDYNLEKEETKEKLKDYCVSFQQEPVGGDKILSSLVHIYQLEHKEATEEEMIAHFRPIRENLKKLEDIYYPTIETVSRRGRAFDFVKNKYDSANVEQIVQEEVRSAKI